MIEFCVCSVFDGKTVARLVFPGLLKGWVGLLNSMKGLKTIDKATGIWMCSICQVIQNPSFRMSFNKSSCQQPLVHHLLINKFFSQWLTVDFDHYLTCRCSASFRHEPSSWNATVAPISMATCLPLTSAPPLHNQWESEWVLDTEILLCNSVADVMCVIFIVNLAKRSAKIFGSTDVYHATQRGTASDVTSWMLTFYMLHLCFLWN